MVRRHRKSSAAGAVSVAAFAAAWAESALGAPQWSGWVAGVVAAVFVLSAIVLFFRERGAPEVESPTVTLVGGPGGSAYVAGDGLAIGGNAGGVAYGENAFAEGGKPGVSAFEVLARGALEMGYPLDDFIRMAGFDPESDELNRIGVGGDSHGMTDGGDGLLVIRAYGEEGEPLQMDVFSTKGHFVIPQNVEVEHHGAEDVGNGDGGGA